MLSSYDVAKYFLSKDTDGKLFDTTLIERNGRKFYQGNARLNKYLHIAQNLFIAKTRKKLFPEDLYAYDNGAVEPGVQEAYSVLRSQQNEVELDAEIKDFLDRVFLMLQNATLEELIEISHEDSEWQDKHGFYKKQQQRMDSLAHSDEYYLQYADALEVLQRMKV